jgi:hypothetical protein
MAFRSWHMRVTYTLDNWEIWITWTPLIRQSSSKTKKNGKNKPPSLSGRPSMYAEHASTGKWEKVAMAQLDFTRVIQEVMEACTEPQISAANLTKFALPIWMAEGGFKLQPKSELGFPAKGSAPLTRRRYLDPTSTGDLTPSKKRKTAVDGLQLPELTKEAADIAISLFKDKSRTLSTKDVLQIQTAEAMAHKKGWVPSPELIHKAREFDQRTGLGPHEFYGYQESKYPMNGPDDEEEAARAKKRRERKSGIVLPPEYTWSVMAKALKWQIKGMNEAVEEAYAVREKWRQARADADA